MQHPVATLKLTYCNSSLNELEIQQYQGDVVQIIPGTLSDEGQTLAERITEKGLGQLSTCTKSWPGRAAVQSRAAMSASSVMPSNRAEPTSLERRSAHLDSRGPRGLDPGIEQSLDAR